MSNLINSNSRFAANPTNIRGIQRSKFDLGHRIKTTFNVGQLVPFDVMEVLPGDTFNVQTNTLARLQTLITPLMDDLYLDFFYFFVPNRLVWEHWKQFNGESEQAWTPSTSYTVPQINIDADDKTARTILDYMGIPVSDWDGSSYHDPLSINALPIRAYCLIWNEWFRDQNLQDPVLVPVDDSTYDFDLSKPYTGGNLLMVNKYHDYFTSALPAPQKGPDVSIPVLGQSIYPVYPSKDADFNPLGFSDLESLKFKSPGIVDDQTFNLNVGRWTGQGLQENEGYLYQGAVAQKSNSISDTLYPTNLVANIGDSSVATINQLRLAFATQQLYELDARGGTRYVEILKSHFGVTSPDARQQRPELLSYAHNPININQVVQQSSTTENTALGDVAGLSVTADSNNSFVKSFTEHGFVIGLVCARYKHSYQQGVNRMWSRKTRFDYYWPVFANLGEQPILNKEIYFTWNGDSLQPNINDEVFGYQEAWAEYRYTPDIVTSEMRSSYKTTLDSWHLADDYAELPKLSSSWIKEDTTTVDRVLAVSSDISAQVFMDIYVKNEATRPMPMYSIPGLTRM